MREALDIPNALPAPPLWLVVVLLVLWMGPVCIDRWLATVRNVLAVLDDVQARGTVRRQWQP
jgi:hypothetical protein